MSGGKHHSTNNGKVAERSKAPGSGTPELADPPGFPGLSNGARVRISPLSATFCRFCVRCRCGAGVMPAWCRRAALHADPLIFDPPSRRPQSCGLVASADVDSRAGYAEQAALQRWLAGFGRGSVPCFAAGWNGASQECRCRCRCRCRWVGNVGRGSSSVIAGDGCRNRRSGVVRCGVVWCGGLERGLRLRHPRFRRRCGVRSSGDAACSRLQKNRVVDEPCEWDFARASLIRGERTTTVHGIPSIPRRLGFACDGVVLP